MNHQQAILSRRVSNLQEGIKQVNKYLSEIARKLHGKESITTEEIKILSSEIEELQTFLDWLCQQ